MRRRKRIAWQSLGLAAVIGAWAPKGMAAVELTSIAATKDVPADYPDGMFQSFYPYATAGSGTVAFTANLSGGVIGLLTAEPGKEPKLVLTTDATLPGHDDVTVYQIYSSFVDSDGHVAALVATTGNSPGNFGALVVEGKDGFEIVAQSGDLIPGADAGGATFYTFNAIFYPHPRTMAFIATLKGDGVEANQNNVGIWIWHDGTLRELMRNGEPTPGIDLQFFDGYSTSPKLIALNSSGKALFRQQVTSAGLGEQSWGMWEGTSSDDTVLDLRSGDGTPAEGFATEGRAAFLTEDDELRFFESVQGDGAPYNGLWGGTHGNIELWLKSGDSVPGLGGENLSFDGFVDAQHSPAFSSSGYFAFKGAAEPGKSGLYLASSAGVRKIATFGQPIEDEGATLGDVANMELNEHGQIAAELTLRAADGLTTETALFRFTPGIGFERIVGANSVVDDHGKPQAVSYYETLCGNDSKLWTQIGRGCIDSDGRVLFTAAFADQRTALVLSSPAKASGDEPTGGWGDTPGGAGASSTGGTSATGGQGGSGATGGSTSNGGEAPGDSGGAPGNDAAGSPSAGKGSGAAGHSGSGGKSSGSGGGQSGGAGKAAQAAGGSGGASSSADSGCGCRTARERSSGSFGWGALALAGIALGRRRRVH